MSTSLQPGTGSTHQVVRLLQIGIVLEEIAAARAAKHARDAEAIDSEVRAFLEDAAADSCRHRSRIEGLVERLDAEPVASADIDRLVEEEFEGDRDSDRALYDHLCSEETAYTFYDDLIAAVENSTLELGVDRERLLSVLETLRAEEAEGMEEVTQLLQDRADSPRL